ncbi:hypothetical protein MZM54_06480 [[Brevibacterium] frigoritolerans]|nr:hypothetical protein [Peribacillus frigoritolerans]
MKNKYKTKPSIGFDYNELVIPVIIMAAVSPVFGFLVIYLTSQDYTNLGIYGDFLGGSTVPFLTTVTVLGLFQTIRLQSNQLNVQKDEFSLLREELESTKKALQDQSKTSKMQRFENSFFIQINELRNSKKELAESYSLDEFSFTYKTVMTTLEENYHKNMGKMIKSHTDELTKKINKDYYTLYEKLMSHAIDQTEMYANENLNTFLDIVRRNLEIIYHYKYIMDNWELNFYLEYVYKEITIDGINMVLFDFCLHSDLKSKIMVKELNFNSFANTTYKWSRRDDFRLLDYILSNELNG